MVRMKWAARALSATCILTGLASLAGCGPKPAVITPPRDAFSPLSVPPGPTWGEAGMSVEGRPIRFATFDGPSRFPRVLILAAIHGDEWQGAEITRRLIDHVGQSTAIAVAGTLVIIPEANPDGLARRRRVNANGVDLNRNFPSSNWATGPRGSRYYSGERPGSEPEVQALMAVVANLRPERILSIHVIRGRSYCNNYDGPAVELAEAMARHNGYPVRADIGYPTPGSLGSWAGKDRRIPTVTLELPAGVSVDQLWDANRDALMAFIRSSR
jgi:protein MpaA